MSSPLRHPAFFDPNQAACYDTRNVRLAPLLAALHHTAAAALGDLPANARILCVGAGTGAEIFALAPLFPGWSFTAVEPAAAMLEICRERAEAEGVSPRCSFHEGYLESLPRGEPFDAALSILVSQFLLDPEDRGRFFQEIAERLKPAGRLLTADLSANRSSADYEALLEPWCRLGDPGGAVAEKIAGLRTVYGRDVAVEPPDEIRRIISSAGFGEPVPIFQTLLLRAWIAEKPENQAASAV